LHGFDRLEKWMIQAIREYNDEQVRHSLERVYLKRLTDELKSERQSIFGLAEIRNTIHWVSVTLSDLLGWNGMNEVSRDPRDLCSRR